MVVVVVVVFVVVFIAVGLWSCCNCWSQKPNFKNLTKLAQQCSVVVFYVDVVVVVFVIVVVISVVLILVAIDVVVVVVDPETQLQNVVHINSREIAVVLVVVVDVVVVNPKNLTMKFGQHCDSNIDMGVDKTSWG